MEHKHVVILPVASRVHVQTFIVLAAIVKVLELDGERVMELNSIFIRTQEVHRKNF